MQLLRVFASTFADPVGLRLGLAADVGGRRFRRLRHPLRDRLRVPTRVGEPAPDLLFQPLALDPRLLGHGQALSDLLRAVRKHGQDRSPEVPTQEVKDDEEVDDRDKHPEGVHD